MRNIFKIGLPSLFLLTILSCKKRTIDNPYLDDVSFHIEINLDLPQYESLQYAGSAIYVQNGGIKGIFLINNGNNILAFEASDPNHYPSDCSKMTLSGLTCSCPCEQNKYALNTGQPITEGLIYSMKPYHVSRNGNILTIYN